MKPGIEFITLHAESTDWIIDKWNDIYVKDDDGTHWYTSVALLRDYTDEMLFESYIHDLGEGADPMSFEAFQALISETLRIVG